MSKHRFVCHVFIDSIAIVASLYLLGLVCLQEQLGPGMDLLSNSATKNWKLLRGWLSVVRSTNKFAYERQNMRISLIPVMKLN